MIEQLACNRSEFLPVMPFADGIFHSSQCLGKVGIAMVQELEQIVQFFDFLAVVVQVACISRGGLASSAESRCERANAFMDTFRFSKARSMSVRHRFKRRCISCPSTRTRL